MTWLIMISPAAIEIAIRSSSKIMQKSLSTVVLCVEFEVLVPMVSYVQLVITQHVHIHKYVSIPVEKLSAWLF